MRSTAFTLMLTTAFAMMAGCTSNPGLAPGDQALESRYTAYEGPPIKSFTWLGHLYGWEALGQDQLVVFTTPSQAYFLKVWPNCDLNFAMNARGDEVIGVTSTSGTVTSGLDSIIENSSAVGHQSCPISEIRKIDYSRMRSDQRAQSQAKATAVPGSPAQRD